MKTCTVCKEEKSDENFSVIKRNEDGSIKYRNSWCNSCKKKKHQEKHGITPRQKKVVTEHSKECTKCHEILPHEAFSVTKRNEDGSVKHVASWCKNCQNESQLDKKGGRTKPIPKVFEDSKECLHCHEVLSFSEFSPSKRGREGLSAYCKNCTLLRRKQDPDHLEKGRIGAKKYRERHTARWRAAHRIHQFNRRSKIKATEDGSVDDMFLDIIYRLVICCWCGKHTEPEERTLEHVIELSQGGTHTRGNIRMACQSCNSSRKGRIKCEQQLKEKLESQQA